MSKFEGVDEVPKVFTPEQVGYLDALIVHHVTYLDSQLANIIDACNLPSKQRKAVRSLMQDALIDYNRDFKEDIELVTAEEEGTEAPEIVTHVDAVCPYCSEHFNSMAILCEDEKQQGVEVKSLLTETCPHCDKEMKVIHQSAELCVQQSFEKIEEGVN